jgi:hypothetical protein
MRFVKLACHPVNTHRNAETEAEMRKLNKTIVVTRTLTNSDHPTRHFFMDHKIQEEYTMKTSISQLISVKAIETFGKQEIDIRKVETIV